MSNDGKSGGPKGPEVPNGHPRAKLNLDELAIFSEIEIACFKGVEIIWIDDDNRPTLQ